MAWDGTSTGGSLERVETERDGSRGLETGVGGALGRRRTRIPALGRVQRASLVWCGRTPIVCCLVVAAWWPHGSRR